MFLARLHYLCDVDEEKFVDNESILFKSKTEIRQNFKPKYEVWKRFRFKPDEEAVPSKPKNYNKIIWRNWRLKTDKP